LNILSSAFCQAFSPGTYYQLSPFAGPHPMSGNAILLKRAPGVPRCAMAFDELLKEAGGPKGVYTNLFLSNQQAGARIDDPRVKGIAMAILGRFGNNEQACIGAARFIVVESVINDPDVSAPDLPFGAIKRSGYGKELSNLGLEEFVNKKWILVPNAA
jgi:acyl-CoA reductase-like NAD-dependent aldehyde dehydrogenase